ncbi:MAG: hypothetical protein JWM11_3039 [Planctomycetaceae bacterium]|nr:hypothetical protein [Planctomycetaceae bacterium]
MELTTAAIPQPESVPTAESNAEEVAIARKKLAVMIIGGLGFAAMAAFFMFTGTSEDSKTAKSQSGPLVQFQTMIGMGPKAGATRFIAPIFGALVIAGMALSLLSAGGRDVQTAKEQAKKGKKPKPAAKEAETPEPEPEEECNLATYKLFKSLLEPQPATDASSTQAEPAKVAETPLVGSST